MSGDLPVIISASILSADFRKLEAQLKEAEQAGIDWVHIDVMDGHFVPNITMGPFIVETIKKVTSLPLDVHLMIQNPSVHLASFASAGADFLGVHIENQPNVHRLVQTIHDMQCKSTVVINPGTPVSALQAILPDTDMVLVMSVNPGFSGQKFITSTVQKIAELKHLIDSTASKAMIQVDGGITSETLPLCYQAGARSFVSASYIFNHPDGIASAVKALQKSVN